MHMPEVALLLVALLFGVYGWLSGLELGVSWLRLSKTGPVDSAHNGRLLTPLWEITNVFLVFGFTAFSVFFNNALPELSRAIFGIGVVAISALLLRAFLALYLYYYRNELGWTLPNVLFALCSYMVPLSFGAIGIYLLTGQLFWQAGATMMLFLVLLTGLAALACSFMQRVNQRTLSNRLRLWTAGLTVSFAGMGTLGLQALLIATYGQHLSGLTFIAWSAVLDATLVYVAVLLLTHREPWLVYWLSFVAIVAPLIWAWANRPYLAFPTLLNVSYGAQAYGKAAVLGFTLIFPVILIGLALFVRLFTTQPSD